MEYWRLAVLVHAPGEPVSRLSIIAPYRLGHRYEIPGAFVIVSGQKPGMVESSAGAPGEHHRASAQPVNSVRSALASLRSAVSNPSVNHR